MLFVLNKLEQIIDLNYQATYHSSNKISDRLTPPNKKQMNQ